MLLELGTEYGTHSIKLDVRPVRHDVPDIEAMRGHSSQRRCGRAEDPVTHGRFGRLAGLVGVLGRRVGSPFELNRSWKEIAEHSVGLFVGSIKADLVALCHATGVRL